MRFLSTTVVLYVSAMSALAADVPSVNRPPVEAQARAVTKPDSVLILPFEDLSGVPEAERELADLMVQQMTAKGWSIVADENLKQRLERDRIRYLDSLPVELTRLLAAETRASAVLMCTIYLYEDGRSPTVALSARLVRADGVVLWGNAVALSSPETEGMFGFGKRNTRQGVAALVVESLMKRFPKPGVVTGVVSGSHGPMLSVSRREFAAPDLATPEPKRVFVLPFRSFTNDGSSARIVADMLTLRLAAARGLTVVSPAELRDAALRANIATFREMSPDTVKRLADALGTPFCVSGAIYSFTDPRTDGGSDPEIDLEIALTDVREGRTLWIAQSEKSGLDYAGFLLRGAEQNAVSLTDRVISDMIAGVVWSDSRIDPDLVARRTQKRLLARRAQLVRATPTGDQE